jgi:hypothetical protein
MKFLVVILLVVSAIGILGGALIINHGSSPGFGDVKEEFQLIGGAIIIQNIVTLIIGLIIKNKS